MKAFLRARNAYFLHPKGALAMQGKNPISVARGSMQGFLIHSLQFTIQGEGPWAGLPALFVRLAGCNQQCWFCDTEFNGGKEIEAAALISVIESICTTEKCKRVVITGGEPMLQPLPDLIRKMPTEYKFQIETAGTVWPEGLENCGLEARVYLVCSPKTPRIHERVEQYARAWKYIIRNGHTDPIDGLPWESTQKPGQHTAIFRPTWLNSDPSRVRRARIFVQACDEGNADKNAMNLQVAAAMAMQHGYRLSVQMHKIAGLP